jgi:hypothetical protein
MAKIADVLAAVNQVVGETPGIQWTVRQMYYRMVTMKVIPNKPSAYKGFDAQLVRLREDGEIDDDLFVDSARTVTGGDEENMDLDEFFKERLEDMQTDSVLFSKALWKDQPYNIMVVLEKDALARLVEEVTAKYRIPLAVGRGYSSRTQILRMVDKYDDGSDDLENGEEKTNLILYLGDHDPTGLDIERSLEDRFNQEYSGDFTIERIALTFEQAKTMGFVPDPTKPKDARASGYVQKYGNQAWELDAIEPRLFQKMIRERIVSYIDTPKWNAAIEEQKRCRKILDKRFELAYDILVQNLPPDDELDDDDSDEGEDDGKD